MKNAMGFVAFPCKRTIDIGYFSVQFLTLSDVTIVSVNGVFTRGDTENDTETMTNNDNYVFGSYLGAERR